MLIRRLISPSLYSACFITRTHTLRDAILKGCMKPQHLQNLQMKIYSTYEGDGKTVGFVLNKKNARVLMLDSVGVDGFVLSDGRQLVGSIIIFPHSLLGWHVVKPEDVNEESLALFKLLDPKIDILVFGYGSPQQYTREIKENFTGLCKKLGIKFEALPTHQAAGLFNFLADDRRYVAGALIPPLVVDRLRFDRKKHLYLNAGLEDDLEEEEELAALESGSSDKKLLK